MQFTQRVSGDIEDRYSSNGQVFRPEGTEHAFIRIVKVLAIALNVDGTTAQDGVLSYQMRNAISGLRTRGITVVLVTGRPLDKVAQIVGDFHIADAVIAENGAVISVPQAGYVRRLGDVPPNALLQRMRLEKIPFLTGECVVETHARYAGRLLDLIRELELPLTLQFDKSRVSIVPQGISKATGLKMCLRILRISSHNTVAIGDAENDHTLLRECELGIAVEWGSNSLKKQADIVLPGTGPNNVANYLATLGVDGQIPLSQSVRRDLLVGFRDDGAPLSLGVRGRNVLVAGDPKSGKSWVVGLLCEQLILHGYSLCILDPEGDYRSLETLPGVMTFGGSHPLPKPRDLVRALRHADVSVVVDLSQTTHFEKLEFVRNLLPAVGTLRRATGLPHRIVLDEAHYFLNNPEALVLDDLSRGGYTLATYRASELKQGVLRAASAIIVTRESNPRELERLVALCSEAGYKSADMQGWETMLSSLRAGEAVALPLTAESGGTPCRLRLAPRLTPHTRHCAKYIDVPVSERAAFIFHSEDRQGDVRVSTLRDFVSFVEKSANRFLLPYMVRGDFSSWISQIFGDDTLAQSIRHLEKDFCRATEGNAGQQIGLAIRTRYQFLEAI